ncbi:MAG: histone deacetylase family protein [Alphaproteobacteria bacterium]|nr:histone deacetylase family protein [Alphaproteobacteria bacterium]MBV9694957.1 histone deacetylase family protein [Alphaproteobacteria bacterium]
MKTFYSPAHLAHVPAEEFEAGRLTPAVEIPERAEAVRARIVERKLGEIAAPAEFDNEAVLRVHDAELVGFLGEAFEAWQAAYGSKAQSALPSRWPAPGLSARRAPDIESRLGTFAFDAGTPIMKGTWQAARAAANVALSAAEAIRAGERSAFALTRPPGHHAAGDVFGGFCYLNNIAIAAQYLRDAGLKPAILDVDYHHGNGTQTIFYGRDDVLFCSLHADPNYAFPHFLGFADERGLGKGEGFNLNLPLPAGTDWARYSAALGEATARLRAFAPDVLLVSLGLDTYIDDPIARFRLKSDDYLRMGEAIAALELPTLFVFEGGYNVEMLGVNAVNVLEGFEGVH